MAEKRQIEQNAACVHAFATGNKQIAEQLLSQISLPATIKTTFKLIPDLVVVVCSMVTLLHTRLKPAPHSPAPHSLETTGIYILYIEL